MTDDRGASRQGDDERINIDDHADVARWAEALCTSPEELVAAVRVVGCDVRRVKGHLFMVLVRRQGGRA
ncbi:MAG: DUF3606 domain-containing protein [Burkholderiales bacterium]